MFKSSTISYVKNMVNLIIRIHKITPM